MALVVVALEWAEVAVVIVLVDAESVVLVAVEWDVVEVVMVAVEKLVDVVSVVVAREELVESGKSDSQIAYIIHLLLQLFLLHGNSAHFH